MSEERDRPDDAPPTEQRVRLDRRQELIAHELRDSMQALRRELKPDTKEYKQALGEVMRQHQRRTKALQDWDHANADLTAHLESFGHGSVPRSDLVAHAGELHLLMSRMKTALRAAHRSLQDDLLERWKVLIRNVMAYRHALIDALPLIQSENPQLAVQGWINIALLDAAADLDDAQPLSPVVLFVSNDDAYGPVRQALDDALEAFGLAPVTVSPRIEGSVWQVLTAAFKRQVEPDRIDQAGDAFTAGAKARWYGEPQSQITKAQGEAVANLLDKLQTTPDALIMISNILIVKVDGVPVVRELTPEQVQVLQENPSLFTDPRLALSRLEPRQVEASRPGPDTGQQSIAR
ncbi:hypothetical protein ACQPZZ_01515 [Microbispora sp. CA-135349]|uniref:hypothetical protein n=1 Tax=Microbispora sp. CA-135349 TaxID=3239953 RepID=UPI003D8DD028